MKQKTNNGAVIKGLAFPVGYTVFMNVVQFGAVFAILGLCLVRALIALIAIPDIAAESLINQYMVDYTNVLSNNTWFLSALTTILALLVLWFVFNRKGNSFTEYFRFTPAPAKAILTAALLGLSLFFISNTLVSLLQSALFSLLEWLVTVAAEYGMDLSPVLEYCEQMIEAMSQMYDGFGMFAVAAIIGAPLIEELTFRAGPLTHLTKRMPAFYAILLTSALFALAHGNPIQMIYTFALGMISGYLFIKTDSIYPSIVCHFVFNGANLIALALEAMFSTDHWIDTPYYEQLSTKLDTWLGITYWSFSIAACLISIPLLIVGILLLVKLRRPAPAAQPAQTEPAPILVENEPVAAVIDAEAEEEV